jgi:hypothetical protein
MSDETRSATNRSRKVAIWLASLAICLVGTYAGLVRLPIPEALAIGAVIAFAMRWKKPRLSIAAPTLV